MIATSHEPSHLSEKERKKTLSAFACRNESEAPEKLAAYRLLLPALSALLLSATNIYYYYYFCAFSFTSSSSVLLNETNRSTNVDLQSS